MEALAVFGIACNVIQVISFARETISLCKVIYSSGIPFENDGHADKIASEYANIYDGLQRKMKDTGYGACAEEKELLSIAKDCLYAAEKLKSATNKLVSPSVKGNALRSIYAGVSAKYKEGRLQRLEATVNRHQTRLESHLLMKICKRTDAIALQQNEKFSSLETTLQTFIQNVSYGQHTIEGLLISHETTINDHTSKEVTAQADSIKAHITNEMLLAQKSIFLEINKWNTIAREDETGGSELSCIRLLNSLKTGGLQERRAQIGISHQGTFEWIYDFKKWNKPAENTISSREPNATLVFNHTCGPKTTARFSCFACWLSQPSGTAYWISGKAGSGKSTLAKFLVSHEKTRRHLEDAHGPTLVLSHFIWLSGSPIQRSLNGILLSLLYQVLHQDQIKEVPEGVAMDPKTRPWTRNASNLILKTVPGITYKEAASDWSYDELKRALSAVLEASPVAVCIFLDGLDEADPDMQSVDSKPVLRLTDWLCHIPRIKVCVSSRPEPAFRSRFSNNPQLALHHLTRDDIMAYVTDNFTLQLPSRAIHGKDDSSGLHVLADKVCEYSDGVFLWVRLVTRSLIRGRIQGDSLLQMHERLENLPRDLNKLYQSMWQRLDEEDQDMYQQEAALYINLALDVSHTGQSGYYSTGTYLSAVQLHSVHCPDLSLEMLANPSRYQFDKIQNECVEFAKRLETVTAGLLEVTAAKTAADTMAVSFIHRSAREFFVNTIEGKTFLAVDRTVKSWRMERVLQGILLAVWYECFAQVSLFGREIIHVARKLLGFIPFLSTAFRKELLDRRQQLRLVHLCQQVYYGILFLMGHHSNAVVWELELGSFAGSLDFNDSLLDGGDYYLLASCLMADLGSNRTIEQILEGDFPKGRLPIIVSQGYKAYMLHRLLRAQCLPSQKKLLPTQQSVLWILDQGVMENWPQGKKESGVVQGVAGAAALAVLRSAKEGIERHDLLVLKRCLALDGAWDEKLVFAFEEIVPRRSGCSLSRDLICGAIGLMTRNESSYLIQMQATMPFLVLAIIQTMLTPKDDESLRIAQELEDEVRRRCPDGPLPAKMFSLHWDDFSLGGGKLGELGFLDISQQSWSSLSLAQFIHLLGPDPIGPIQEAVLALDAKTCKAWDLDEIQQEVLSRIGE